MDISQDLRHISMTSIDNFGNVKLKRLNLAALFIIQFLISQIFLSYGMYAVYVMNENDPILERIFPPLILLVTSKLFSPLFRDITDFFYEQYFRQLVILATFICFFGVGACYFFSEHIIVCSIFYGFLGGIGISVMLPLIKNHLDDVFPYQNHLVGGVEHVGIALGFLFTPYILQLFLKHYDNSLVFLFHAVLLLNIIPAGFLFRKSTNICMNGYNNHFRSGQLYDQEMIEIQDENSINNRNWKSPSDQIEYENILDNDDEIEKPTLKLPSPTFQRSINMGINILPQIEEEDEIETDDEETSGKNKDEQVIKNDLKRLSVISTKLEELIVKDDEEIVLDINNLKSLDEQQQQQQSLPFEQNNNLEKNTITIEETGSSICGSYNRQKYKNQCKWCFASLFNITLRPLFRSFRILEFYICLLTNIHAMLSPLIFLNFIAFKMYYNFKQEIELPIMYSIIAFGYIVFMITLTWVTEISRRNMKYLYTLGCLISGIGVYMSIHSKTVDYIIVSCIIYGFGFGIESFLKDIVLKETLGVTKWSRTESTLQVLSGLLLAAIVFSFRQIISDENITELLVTEYSEAWLDVIFASHLIVFVLWTIFPIITYFFYEVCCKNKRRYNLP